MNLQELKARCIPWATVVLLLLLGIGLRALALSQEAAWGDEALTTVCFPSGGLRAYLDCVFSEDDRLRLAPVYYYVQFGWSQCFGGTLNALRALSIALSVVAGLQLYGLIRSLHSHRAACWALFLFSVSLFEIYYGQEVRFYALMNVFALAALQGAWWYTRGHTRAGLALAVVGNGGLVWTHTFAVVFVLALGVYMLRYLRAPKRLIPWFAVHGAMAVTLFGWLAWLRYDFDGQSAAYGDMGAGWRELANTAIQFAGGRFSNIDPAAYIAGGWSADLILTALMALLVGMLLALSLRSRAGRARSAESWLLLTALILPPLLLFTLGKVWRPCFFTRYVIYSALPLYGLAGMAMASLPSGLFRRGVAVLLVVLFAWQNLALPRPFRADYGAVARAVATDPAPEKAVLALKPFNYDAVAYALRDSGVTVELLLGLKEIAGITRARAAEGKSVWVVFYRWSDLEAFERQLADAPVTISHFTSAGMPPLTIYHVVPATGV